MPLPMYRTLDDLIGHYTERMNKDNKNMERVKKLINQYKEDYFKNDDGTFDEDAGDHAFGLLMGAIINKDTIRFKNLIDGDNNFPNPWRVFYVVLDIVQNEGEEAPPFDTLTKMLPSRTLMYHGWTFSWVHGENDLISIFNRSNELVYRF
jgi:hypothetical protein